jgi:hypothetical protein
LGKSIVIGIASFFEHLGCCLFFDRFFCSLPLLWKLSMHGLYDCGTIFKTRNFFPKTMLAANKDLKSVE